MPRSGRRALAAAAGAEGSNSAGIPALTLPGGPAWIVRGTPLRPIGALMHTLAGLLGLGTWEAIALLGLGLLLFGRRLPEVGKSLGKSIVEFRKGLSGIEREIDDASSRSAAAERERMRPPLTEGGEEDPRVSRASTRVAAEGSSGPAA